MRAVLTICVLLAAAGNVLAQKSQPAIGPSLGGTYTLTIDRNKPIPVTSLAFADPGVSALGTAKDAPSQVFVTTSTGVGALPTLVHACETGGHFGRVIATYTNLGGHVEFTVELKKVSVDSITLPGVDRAAKQLDDIGWTLSAEHEQLDYKLMQPQGNGLSAANKKRLERVHDRVEAIMWMQVKQQNWHAPPTEVAPPSGGAFSLDLGDLTTNGVRAVGPLAFEAEPGKDKPRFTPLTLTVDSARAADFAAAIKANKTLPIVTLTYYRTTEEDKQAEIRVVLKGVTLKPEPISDAGEARSTITVTMEFEGIEMKVS